MAFTVLVADAYPASAHGLCTLINTIKGARAVGLCHSVESLVQYHGERPDLLILDLDLGGSPAFDLVTETRQRWPKTRVLVSSGYEDVSFAARSLRAGATGFVLKTADHSELIAAIRQTVSGGLVFSEEALSALVGRTDPRVENSPAALLSNRELQVFTLMGRGFQPQTIADRLNIALATVYKHVANVKEKLSIPAGGNLTYFATIWTNQIWRSKAAKSAA